jgi:hypothetical protein
MENLDEYSEPETERRREAALKRMLSTPHKPHAESASKSKKRRKLSPSKDAERVAK